MPKGNQARKPALRKEREAKWLQTLVLQGHVTGKSALLISQELDVSLKSVNDILDHADEHFTKLATEMANVLRGRELATLGWVQKEAIEAVAKSKTLKTTKTKTSSLVSGGKAVKVQEHEITEERPPETSALNVLVKVSEGKRRMLGLDQPLEMKHVHQRLQEGRQALLQAVVDVITSQTVISFIKGENGLDAIQAYVLEAIAKRGDELEGSEERATENVVNLVSSEG